LEDATGRFVLRNDPTGTQVRIATADPAKFATWRHIAFVYNHRTRTIDHYVDGQRISRTGNVRLKALPPSPEAYVSVGRNGFFAHPLNGAIDELTISAGALYTGNFSLPASHSE